MSLLEIAATVVGVFLGLSNIPQAYKIFQRKSADDLALTTYLIVIVGAFIWVLYGIEQRSIPIIVPNTLGFISTAIVLWGYYLYGKKKNQ